MAVEAPAYLGGHGYVVDEQGDALSVFESHEL